MCVYRHTFGEQLLKSSPTHMSSSTSPNHSDLPLAGLKVVDLSQGVAGPHCGMLFAQYGADVVKVEPTAGDWGRAIGAQHGDFCAYFAAFNRGKRSLAVNLKSEFGLMRSRTLMAQADVVIENYRPGVLKRFGLDYSSVVVDNTDVIYVSVTGFGQRAVHCQHPRQPTPFCSPTQD